MEAGGVLRIVGGLAATIAALRGRLVPGGRAKPHPAGVSEK